MVTNILRLKRERQRSPSNTTTGDGYSLAVFSSFIKAYCWFDGPVEGEWARARFLHLFFPLEPLPIKLTYLFIVLKISATRYWLASHV